jgi:beta-galactosidase
MRKYFNESFKHFLHGGDYNPEQWKDYEGVWDEDMRLMKKANCNEMTMGIFSWATIEPREGEFDFSILDEMIDRVYKNGGRVILATPSGARPRWLAEKYPEVLRVNEYGHRKLFGARHNHCPNSPVYREKVRIIDEKLAERYGKHPAVLGWHISNEFDTGDCWCEYCQAAFHKFLKDRYGDVKTINDQWWANFWSHTIDSFDQVDPPGPLGDHIEGLRVDWRRYTRDAAIDFMDWEIKAVRKYSSLPVTTNLMPHHPIDNVKMAQHIDIVSWDSYPSWNNEEPPARPAAWTAQEHDSFRASKGKPYLLMESTPSLVNWKPVNKLKRPGMHKLASMQAVAHGADAVLYFQWRKSRGSREKFHGAVVDHLGTENNRVFKEVAEVGATLKKIEEVLGSTTKARAAIVWDVENKWLVSITGGLKDNKNYDQTVNDFYYELWSRAIDTDEISLDMDFSKYQLVIMPMPYSLTKSQIEKIEKYVKDGGTLITTYLTGYVNENDLCYLGGFPGENLKDVFGVWAEEIDTLYPTDRNAIVYDGEECEVVDFCERIHPLGSAKVIATYRDDFYAGEPAVIENSYGKGKTYYIAARDTGKLKNKLIGKVLADLKIPSNVGGLSEGVSAHKRTDGETEYLFVENYNPTPREVTLLAPATDMESGEKCEGTIKLDGYGVRIFKQPAAKTE